MEHTASDFAERDQAPVWNEPADAISLSDSRDRRLESHLDVMRKFARAGRTGAAAYAYHPHLACLQAPLKREPIQPANPAARLAAIHPGHPKFYRQANLEARRQDP